MWDLGGALFRGASTCRRQRDACSWPRWAEEEPHPSTHVRVMLHKPRRIIKHLELYGFGETMSYALLATSRDLNTYEEVCGDPLSHTPILFFFFLPLLMYGCGRLPDRTTEGSALQWHEVSILFLLFLLRYSEMTRIESSLYFSFAEASCILV